MPILFIHAIDDWDIPYTHSETLFDALMEPILPPIASTASASWSKEEWDTFYTTNSARNSARNKLVTQSEIPHFGTVDEFVRGRDGHRVVFLKMIDGGHNKLGTYEGVHEVMRTTFGFT